MKKIYLLLGLFFLTGMAHAQLLWEISGNGLEKPSYLYGTMHLGDERIYQFNDSLMVYFDQCEAFAGELLLEQSLGQSIGLMMDMMMDGDTTLRDLLSQEEYALVKRKLDKKLEEMGMKMMGGFFERVQPIFVSVIMTDMDAQAVGGNSREPVDMFFQKIAKQKEMEVIGLETIDEQMQVFKDIPLKKQAKMLYDELNKKEGAEEEMDLDKMIDLYASENIDSLYKLTAKGFDNEINESLLYRRNVNMAYRMIPFMKKMPIFVGVGAAHLPGEGGIIDLLRKKGYSVRPVNYKPVSEKDLPAKQKEE